MSLYAVCENLQQKEIDRFCFKDCGKILVGGLSYNGLYWSPCRTEDCPHSDRETKIGKVKLDVWGEEELTLRKLKSSPEG